MPALNRVFVLSAALLALTLSACGDNDKAASPANSDVRTRQATMKDWRSSMDILKGMQENPANFNADLVKEQANFFVESSAKVWTHFNDANAKGRAQDAVWSDPATFKAKQDNFNTAITALQTAAQTATSLDGVDKAISTVNESCGSCHKEFKQR